MNTFINFFLFILLLKSTIHTYNGYLNSRSFTKFNSCGFKDYYDLSNRVAAISSKNYDSSLACGGCVKIKNSNGDSIRLKVIDKCNNCAKNSFEISNDAYEILKIENKKEQKISWDWVPCYTEGNFQYYIDTGDSDYFITFQVRNASMRVKNVYLYNDIYNVWISMSRTDNFFFYYITNQVLQKPFLIKIESVSGEIIDDIIGNLEAGEIIMGSAKFSENGDKNFGDWIRLGAMIYLLLALVVL